MKVSRKYGFTMVEILLVVIIIGILAAMVVPNIAGRGDQARITAARSDIETSLASALDLYELDNGRYPSTEQGLRALIEKPSTAPVPRNWNGPYLKKKTVPKDPWGVEYVYAAPGVHDNNGYDLSSYGPDGVESEDDIVSWVSSDER